MTEYKDFNKRLVEKPNVWLIVFESVIFFVFMGLFFLMLFIWSV